MSLLDRPNLLSLFILGFVVVVAGGYGLVTYTQSPDMEHYAVDPNYDFAFNFDRPDHVAELPKDLKEISGLSPWMDDTHLLAVQDEDGIIFVVNPANGTIAESFKFGKDRDYEGIARLGDTIYVLERDGDIHRMRYVKGMKDFESEKLETLFSYRNDTEGVEYDPVTGHLLMVPKEEELNPGDNSENRRGIYSYDLGRKRMQPQPSFYIDEMEVGQVVYGKEKRYSIKPSGIAVDPITNDIYVISSLGKIMVVINRENEIKHIELLKEKVFRQPEGITFNAAGDLFISSEGRGGQAILATYRRAPASVKSMTE